MRIEYLSKNYPQRLYQELINIEDQAEKDSYIRKIINVAYNVGHLTILEMIVDNIKENQLITPATDVDILHCLVRKMPTTCIKFIKDYKPNQAVLNSSIIGFFGMTPLMIAAEIGNTDVVKALIEAGADIEVKRFGSKTALMHAAESGNTDVVEALIEAGADKEAKNRCDNTALMLAAENGRTDVVKALIKAGADKEAKDICCNTALIYAARCGKTDVLQALIDAGADIEAKHQFGNTALMFAVQYGKTDVALVLIKAGANFDDTKHKKVDPEIKKMALKYQKEHSDPTLSSLRKLKEGRVKIDSLEQDLHLEDKKHKLLTQISMQGFGPSQLKEKLKDDKLDKALLFESLGLDVSGLDAKQIGKLTKTAIKILDKEDNPNIERLAEQLVVKTEMLKIKNNLEHSQSSGKSFADGVTESRKQAGKDQGNFWSKLCYLQ